MWSLPLPSIADADAQLTAALTYANGQPVYALSAAERGAINAVYQLYDALLGQPAPELRPGELDACRPIMANAYDEVQIGGRLASLRYRLLSAAETCPYCGFGEPTQLDHYLPKSTYGELAIYPRNLIPSCGPCNNAKRTVVPGGPGAGFLHTYFEPLPNVTFLNADLTFADGALDVTFRILPGVVAAPLQEKLEFQLVRAKLNARYPRQINKFLSEQRTAVLLVHEGAMGELSLAQFFALNAAALADVFGRNDWRPALMTALAQSGPFCAEPERYLGEREFPVNPALADGE